MEKELTDVNSIAALPNELQDITMHEVALQTWIKHLVEYDANNDKHSLRAIKGLAEDIVYECGMIIKLREKYENKE